MSGAGVPLLQEAVLHASAFHWLRPWWLLALPVIAWMAWAWRRRHAAGAWEAVVDPALREHLLEPVAARRRWLAWWPWLAAALAVAALAGPSWRRDAQPLWEAKTPLLVAFDLSPAMLATDLPPSRLARARAKLATLLRERRGGEVGLLVYADGAYTVAPLTDDAANVAVFVDALAPDIMPGDADEADAAAAIDRAATLMRQAGFARGDILLVSGSAMGASVPAAAARAAAGGYRVSVLDAVPPAATGAARAVDAGGVAAAGGGRRARLAAGDGALASLGVLDASAQGALARGREGGASWRDEGYWLLLPLLLLAAFAFRRNGAIAVLALCLLLPWRPAAAAGIDWWRRADQQAHERMEQGARAYRAGDYAAAERAWRGVPGAEADYDRGNALARQGRYDEAIAAYDEALRAKPGMADAIANRKAVEAARKRRPPSGKGDRDDAGDKGDGNQDQEQDAGKRDAQADAARAQAGQAAREREAARRARAGDAGPPQDGRMQETQAQHERRLANQARLQRVPDDPGGLLRERLRLEYERRRTRGE
ncbi:MAG: VWA domain-containing protein [Luteimonas sp.]